MMKSIRVLALFSVFILLSASLGSCGETSISKAPASAVPSKKPEPVIASAKKEPRLVLNPDDPFKGNKAPKLTNEYAANRVITPIAPDVLKDMPTKTFTSYVDGWALQEVMPIGYHSYISSNRSGNLFFEKVNAFTLCEVKPEGVDGESFAIINTEGRQITNADFKPSPSEWVFNLPSYARCSDGSIKYVDGNGNFSYKNEGDYITLGSKSDGWDVYSVYENSSEYVVFTTPKGKEIVEKSAANESNYRYGLLPNDILAFFFKNYVIAYNADCKAVWKLEFDGRYYTSFNFSNGLNRFLGICNQAGHVAIYNSDGIRLTDFIYESVRSTSNGDYFVISIDGKCGIISANLQQVLPCEYDSCSVIEPDSDSKGVILSKDGFCGYMDAPFSGEWAIPCEYEDISYNYSTHEFSVMKDGVFYIWQNGSLGNAVEEGGIFRYDAFDEGIYIKYDEDFWYDSIVKADGTVLYDKINIGPIGDNGLILFKDPTTELYGYMNSSAEIVIEAQYDLADAFCKGFAIVRKDSRIKLIDKANNVIMDTVFYDVMCWNPNTMVMMVTYYPDDMGDVLPDNKWDHNTSPKSRCGLVKLSLP